MGVIEGLVILWALVAAVKGAAQAVGREGGRAAQNATQRAGTKAQLLRSSPRRRDRAAGRAMQAGGAVAAGAVRGIAAGVRAAAGGAKDGFRDGLEAAQRWRDDAPARRQRQVERRTRRAANRVTGRAGRRQRQAQRRQWREEDRGARRARRDAIREEREQRIVDRAHDEAVRDPEWVTLVGGGTPRAQGGPPLPTGTPPDGPAAQGAITVDPPTLTSPPTSPSVAAPPGMRWDDPLPEPGPPPPVPPPPVAPPALGWDDPLPTTDDDQPRTVSGVIVMGGHCEWPRGCPAPADVALTCPDGTPGGHFCIPHAIQLNKRAEQVGEAPRWTVLNPTPPAAIEGAPAVSATTIPAGEIQGKADTGRALAGYRGEITAHQDDLHALHVEASEMWVAANRASDQQAAAEIGERTLQAFGAIQEDAAALVRITTLFDPAAEAELSALAEFEAAVAAHDNVEAAALANTDGGTTEYHQA